MSAFLWTIVLACLVAVGATLAGVAVVARLFPARGWARPNYAGRPLPLGAGWAFVLGGASGVLCLARATAAGPFWWVAGPLFMAVLGWLDDRYGSHAVRGFSAHLRSLARGRLTTGGLKLLGGGLFALAATLPRAGSGSGTPTALAWAVPADPTAIAAWLADALLVALATNTVNALDLRPGRAVKGWVLLAAVALLAGARPLWLVPIAAAVMAYSVWDLRARMMMGDTGSNALGATAGLALVSMPDPAARWVAASVLVAFHLWMERHSLTEWLERHPAAAWLDRLGRPAS